MDADFSIELGREDPVLDFPWKDPTANLAYVDLKQHPESLPEIAEAKKLPELGEFLRAVNSPRSGLETAKCDAWETTELNADEIYSGTHKFASYVDVVFSVTDAPQSSLQNSFPAHERFAKSVVELLSLRPEICSAVEICLRRCFFGGDMGDVREGFYWTIYVSGFGDDGDSARQNWALGLKEVCIAIASTIPIREFPAN